VTGMLLDAGGCGAATPGSGSGSGSGSGEPTTDEGCGRAWDRVLGISAALYALGAVAFFVGVTAERRYR